MVEIVRIPVLSDNYVWLVHEPTSGETMGRGILLWLLGVPIPVIILLWLFFGH